MYADGRGHVGDPQRPPEVVVHVLQRPAQPGRRPQLPAVGVVQAAGVHQHLQRERLHRQRRQVVRRADLAREAAGAGGDAAVLEVVDALEQPNALVAQSLGVELRLQHDHQGAVLDDEVGVLLTGGLGEDGAGRTGQLSAADRGTVEGQVEAAAEHDREGRSIVDVRLQRGAGWEPRLGDPEAVDLGRGEAGATHVHGDWILRHTLRIYGLRPPEDKPAHLSILQKSGSRSRRKGPRRPSLGIPCEGPVGPVRGRSGPTVDPHSSSREEYRYVPQSIAPGAVPGFRCARLFRVGGVDAAGRP